MHLHFHSFDYNLMNEYKSSKSRFFDSIGVLSTQSPIPKQKVTMYLIPLGIEEPYEVDFCVFVVII